MDRGLHVPSLLRYGVVLCSACSLVIGDVPDNPGSNDGGQGVATTSAGGHAGDGGSMDAGADDSRSGVGGSATGGSGVGGGSGGGAGGVGGVSSGGGAGIGGMSAGGSAGRGASSGSGGVAPGDGSAGNATGGARDAGNGGGAQDAPASNDAPRDVFVGPDTGVDAPDPCDKDGDMHRSELGNCGGDDCDDNQPDVHPGQTMYFVDPTHPGGTEFDYDCNGVPDLDPQYKAIDCSTLLGLNCDQSGSGFLGQNLPACGQAAPFGHCAKPLLNCQDVVEQQNKKMPCK